ncbi:MAG TPA: hypothetical protein VK509_25830 [Polyangiales bacterium]|nr:hypothetical protein [Polyangiales bacterium]
MRPGLEELGVRTLPGEELGEYKPPESEPGEYRPPDELDPAAGRGEAKRPAES